MAALVDTFVSSSVYNSLLHIQTVASAPDENSNDLEDLRDQLVKYDVPKDVSIRLVHNQYDTVDGEVMAIDRVEPPPQGVVQRMRPVVPSINSGLPGIHDIVHNQGALQAYEYADCVVPDTTGLFAFFNEFSRIVTERKLQREFALKIKATDEPDQTGWTEYELHGKRSTTRFPDGVLQPGDRNSNVCDGGSGFTGLLGAITCPTLHPVQSASSADPHARLPLPTLPIPSDATFELPSAMSAMANMATLPKLPSEVLSIIMDLLNNMRDLLSFASTCQSTYHSFRSHRITIARRLLPVDVTDTAMLLATCASPSLQPGQLRQRIQEAAAQRNQLIPDHVLLDPKGWWDLMLPAIALENVIPRRMLDRCVDGVEYADWELAPFNRVKRGVLRSEDRLFYPNSFRTIRGTFLLFELCCRLTGGKLDEFFGSPEHIALLDGLTIMQIEEFCKLVFYIRGLYIFCSPGEGLAGFLSSRIRRSLTPGDRGGTVMVGGVRVEIRRALSDARRFIINRLVGKGVVFLDHMIRCSRAERSDFLLKHIRAVSDEYILLLPTRTLPVDPLSIEEEWKLKMKERLNAGIVWGPGPSST